MRLTPAIDNQRRYLKIGLANNIRDFPPCYVELLSTGQNTETTLILHVHCSDVCMEVYWNEMGIMQPQDHLRKYWSSKKTHHSCMVCGKNTTRREASVCMFNT